MTVAASRGRFVWYDLFTSDPKAAEAFYTKVANWGTQAWQDGYTMWTANGQPIGGVMTLPPGMTKPHWVAYITVPDVDQSVEQAIRLGGTSVSPAEDVPSVGRLAVLADPQGAVFAVFTPTDAPPAPEKDPAIGEFSWHELGTTDYKAGFAFYEQIFGWEKSAEHDMGEMGVYFIFKRNGKDLGGMYTMPPGMPIGPHWMQYVRVDSADAAADRVKAGGGQIVNGPMDVPGGDRVAVCGDPQGGAFAVHSK